MFVTFDAGLIGPVLISNWPHVLGISLLAGLIPNILFSVAAPVIGSARAAMAGSMELPTMFVVGWLAFGEEINFLTAFAGALVLAAILITPSTSPKPIEQESGERW
jgi:drug/metabolite transporter (DMT)-like permease